MNDTHPTTAPAIRKTFLDYDARFNPKTAVYCCKCQKDITGTNYRWVHLIDGGAFVLHSGDEAAYVADAGDCGSFRIGSDCARKLGLEWSTPN